MAETAEVVSIKSEEEKMDFGVQSEKIKKFDKPSLFRNAKDIWDKICGNRKAQTSTPLKTKTDEPVLMRKNPEAWEKIYGKPLPNPGVYVGSDPDSLDSPAVERNKPQKWNEITKDLVAPPADTEKIN